MAIKLAMPFFGDNYYAIDHIFLEKKKLSIAQHAEGGSLFMEWMR